MTKLEEKLVAVEAAYSNEQEQHGNTRGLLRIALRYIRDVLAWGVGDRVHPLPEPPAEIFRHLTQPET
ncbi:hypothetical protein [Mycobacteroides abscessus]|uniref:hypothetical protein n=1 Tax=Mycobacteroides abscessus TaxID=36809 RepID=UPI001F15FD13|nr:hypothetical protein [Mycobacteroides abscessus]